VKRPALALALLCAGAALVVARPLPWELTAGLPVAARGPVDRPVLSRSAGDTLQLYYQLWLFRDGLVGPTPFLRDPYQFRVDGPRWNLPQTFPPLALPFTVLSVFGSHAAYNLLLLLSFPAAGLAAYALARRYTAAAVPALVAGLGFALVPARLGPLFGGHPAGFAAVFVPLAFWGFDLAVASGRVAGGVAGGLALLALATLEPHYTYLIGGLLAVYVPLRWLGAGRPRRAAPALLAGAGLGALGAGWLLMLRQSFLVGSIADAGRSLAEVRLFSAGPAALAVPAAYGGGALLLLALAGLALPGPRRDRALRVFYGGTLVLGVLLALGPTLPGVPVYEALYRWLPLFKLIRNPEKFRILVSLGVVVLAALGTAALLARVGPRPARGLGLALLALVLVETPPWHRVAVARFPESPVYARLRQEATRVLYLPVWPGDSAFSSVYLYTVTRTRVPTLNGYSPLVSRRYVDEVFEPLAGLNVGDLDPAAHARLRELGVSHVVVDRAVFPPQVSPFPSRFTIARLEASAALALEASADPLWVFRVTPEPPRRPALSSPVGVFFEAERLPRATGSVGDDPEASAGRAVVAHPGADRAGFLTFGPYRPLPAGAYRARFRVRGGGLTIEVTADRGRRLLAQRAVTPGPAWVDAELPFTVDRAGLLEYRVRWDGREGAAVDWVAVVSADRPDPEWVYEVEALPHKLGERQDAAASGGWAGYADPGESLRTDLVAGPARLFPAGRYRLVVRVRAEGAATEPPVRLAVSEPAGRILAARTVDAAEMPPGAYREVGLDFDLARPTVLEFPVGYLGGTGVFFDRLAVTPR
jgi:hypothetical protein